MTMRLMSIAAILAAAACGDAGVGGDGDLDAGPDDGDAGPLTAGLRLELETVPEVSGSWDSDFNPVIDEVELVFQDIRVVGDAGGNRTRIDEVTLRWTEPEVMAIEFADAPIGRYSRIRARIDSIDLEGTLEIGGETEEWKIEDKPPAVDVDLEIEVDLEPAEIEIIRLQIDVARLFDEIDWDQVDPDGEGDYVIDNNSSMIEAVYDRLGESISVVEDDDSDLL